MTTRPLQVLCVVGTTGVDSATHAVMDDIARQLRAAGAEVDVFDSALHPLPMFNPQKSYALPEVLQWQARVDRADVFVLGTPDYHGSISGALKNFLDHFWQEFSGKLFAHVVGSNDKGLTVMDQLRTIARQCYGWSLPYGVSFAARTDVVDGRVAEALAPRIEMMVHDLLVYGRLLRDQRQADLAGTAPGFLARLRPGK